MKVGVIGCGGIAFSHIQTYQNIEGVNVVALCDLDLKKAKNLSEKFKIKSTFENYWDMFEKEEVDLVDICTPVTTHGRIVCDVAKAVQAILVEKPMALTVSECDEMIKEAGKHNTKLCIGHNQLFSPHVQKLKSMVESGEFNLFSLKTTLRSSYEILKAHNFAHPWNISAAQRGIIWEVCCHHAYLQLHFLPGITEVYALGGKVKYPVYDDFAVLLRTSGESFGAIEISWISRETEVNYEFRDLTGRRIEIEPEFDNVLEKSEEPPFNKSELPKNFFVDEKRLLQRWVRFGISHFRSRKLLPLFHLISSYVKSIEKDLPPPVTPKDGRDTINLLECIEKSLIEQRPVKLRM